MYCIKERQTASEKELKLRVEKYKLKIGSIMVDVDAGDEEEGFLGSIGFMFDAQHVRLTKTVTFGDNISLQLRLIGEDPGHVQSGQYLWPAAAFTGQYLLDNWSDLQAAAIVELGAGVGLAGLVASRLQGAEKVVLTDYDHGSLQLLNDNIELNKIENDTCKVTVEFLEWGKTLECQNEGTASSSGSSSSGRPITDSSSGTSSSKINNSIEANSSSSSIENHTKTNESFALVLGTDLLYCKEIVRPLFKSAKLLMEDSETTLFVLVSSFNTGEDIEALVNVCCKELGLTRQQIIELDELRNICRVEYFRHVNSLGLTN